MSKCVIFKGTKDKQGYGKLKRGGKVLRAHRVAYQEAKGEIPEGFIICHSCDTPSCINPDHLFLGTHKDNSDDKVMKGRQKSPCQKHSLNHNAKLTDKDVEKIRHLISKGRKNTEIAAKFGVHHATISNIRRGISWQ